MGFISVRTFSIEGSVSVQVETHEKIPLLAGIGTLHSSESEYLTQSYLPPSTQPHTQLWESKHPSALVWSKGCVMITRRCFTEDLSRTTCQANDVWIRDPTKYSRRNQRHKCCEKLTTSWHVILKSYRQRIVRLYFAAAELNYT